MAVKVYDREGHTWEFERGVAAEADDFGLLILDADRNVVGGFNGPAWTHFAVPRSVPRTSYITTIDEEEKRRWDTQTLEYLGPGE